MEGGGMIYFYGCMSRWMVGALMDEYKMHEWWIDGCFDGWIQGSWMVDRWGYGSMDDDG